MTASAAVARRLARDPSANLLGGHLRAMRTVFSEAPAIWGVRVTFGSASRGLSAGGGSTAKVSSTAPRRVPSVSA